MQFYAIFVHTNTVSDLNKLKKVATCEYQNLLAFVYYAGLSCILCHSKSHFLNVGYTTDSSVFHFLFYLSQLHDFIMLCLIFIFIFIFTVPSLFQALLPMAPSVFNVLYAVATDLFFCWSSSYLSFDLFIHRPFYLVL